MYGVAYSPVRVCTRACVCALRYPLAHTHLRLLHMWALSMEYSISCSLKALRRALSIVTRLALASEVRFNQFASSLTNDQFIYSGKLGNLDDRGCPINP